jgi:hypothetical protein
MSLSSCSCSSSTSGSGHDGSPDRRAACSTVSRQSSGRPKMPAVSFPSATVHAPVSVAMSTRCVAPRALANQSASPRIRRPSASVLRTSTVLPLALRSTSPGRSAPPPGMFSAAGTTPMTRSGIPSSAIARMAAITAAPPAMSSFIRSMPSADLIEMPPESKVTPFPTRPSTGPACRSPRSAAAGSCVIAINRGGSLLPRPTADSSPMPSSPMAFSSRTSIFSAVPAVSSRARSASTRGGSWFPGSLTSSRARFAQWAICRPRQAAAASSCRSPAVPGGTAMRGVKGARGGADL